MATYPPIIGTPGGGLHGDRASTWAADGAAQVGERGELATAEVLARFARAGGPTVVHDLTLPVKGSSANIDHVVISGRNLWIIDSKCWLPGTYWTWRGVTRRGLAPFPVADKRYLGFAAQVLDTYCAQLGLRAHIRLPLIVVWPSREAGRVSVRWYQPKAARAVPGPSLGRVGRRLFSSDPADPRVVSAMAGLLSHPPTPTSATT